jgi:hypothetical protein
MGGKLQWKINQIKEKMGKQIGKCGPCPVFASYTLEFALQLRKKQVKTSVGIVESCLGIPLVALQYTLTHKQQYNTHSHTNNSTVQNPT